MDRTGLLSLLLVSACILFSSLLHSSAASPFVLRALLPVGTGSDATGDGQASDAHAGPVPVDQCVEPSSSPVCGVDYAVPASLAAMADAIEMDIEGTYGGSGFELLHGTNCSRTAKRIACAQRFPRCVTREDGSTQVQLTSLRCEEMLEESCWIVDPDMMIQRGFCALQNSTQDLAGCKSVAERDAQAPADAALQHCTPSQQWQVTPWMYEQLKYYDAMYAGIERDVQALYPGCTKPFANFTCQQVGRCSEDGERVEQINTYQICQSFINCFPDDYADTLRERYDCNHWPHQVFTPAPTNTPPSDTKPPSSTWPSPPVDVTSDMVGGNGACSYSLTLWTLSLIAVSVSFLHTL